MLRAKTKQELHTALIKEYGNAQGGLIYNHLKQIFMGQDTSEINTSAKPTW